MSKFLRAAALTIVVTATGMSSAWAGTGLLSQGPNVTTRVFTSSPYVSQTAKQRPCVSREVLDRTRGAFYDSCTGAFIRPFVR